VQSGYLNSTVMTMKLRVLLVVAACMMPMLSRADIIVAWNQSANGALSADGPQTANNPVVMARSLAMMHVAMFDAIDACDPRYRHFTGASAPAPAPGASAQAAAHAAARTVLTALHPRQHAMIDKHYAEAIAELPDDAGKAAGIALGEQSARLILGARQNDGTFDTADAYRPYTTPGTYVPTGLPVISNVAMRKPFALQSVTQFRPGPPPALTSATWARDFNETKEWGSASSTRRSTQQTETARFWEQLGTPAWNQIARHLADRQPMALPERARVFAQLNIAMFDAYLAVFDTKYHYNFWRPVTAIRNGDRDGNDATERDPGWRPLIDTPPHPEYPCAHCTADGAAGAVMKAAFGAGTLPPFTVIFPAMPGVKRDYSSIRQLQEEVAMARIWGGVHYRTSNEVGEILGTKVGDHVLATTFREIP
jgi:hypothetical protein